MVAIIFSPTVYPIMLLSFLLFLALSKERKVEKREKE
jgi:hypothetical protein